MYGGGTSLSGNPDLGFWAIYSWESEITSSRVPELNEYFNASMTSVNRQYVYPLSGWFSFVDVANLHISDYTGILTYSRIDGRIDSFGAIPEPSTLALLGIGIAVLIGWGWSGRRVM